MVEVVGHSQEESKRREPLMDIVRGIAVVLMITAHAIYFFHTDSDPILRTIARGSNAVVFTLFLLVSGWASCRAYLQTTLSREHIAHILKRTLVVYFGYLAVAFTGVLTSSTLTFNEAIANLLLATVFLHVPNFSEFLIPLIFYPLTILLFHKFYRLLLRSWQRWFFISIFVYGLGFLIFLISLPYPMSFYKALLAGEEGMLRFPLLQYFPVFSLGLLWCAQSASYKEKAGRFIYNAIVLSGMITAIASGVSLLSQFALVNPLNRWPPSLGFLSLGLFVAFSLATGVSYFLGQKALRLLFRVLDYIGKDAFDLYIVSTIMFFLYSRFFTYQFSGILPVVVLTILFLAMSIFVSSLNWNISPSIFALGPFSISNAKRYRIKKRYLITVGAIALFVFSQLNIPQASSVGDFIEKSTLTLPTDDAEVQLNRKWFVRRMGEPIGPLVIMLNQIKPNEEKAYIYTIRETGESGELVLQEDGKYKQVIDISRFGEGEYTLTIRQKQSFRLIPLFETKFYLTQPLYVSWTFDWEGWDVADSALASMQELSTKHGVPFTHFFNPRVYLPSVVDSKRADILSTWIKDRVDSGDALALHFHMHFDLVEAAGVTPKHEPKWGYRSDEGYDVYTTAYSYDELTSILSWSLDQFTTNGLPRPYGYRAGGWFADTTVLQAVADSGFLYDASGRERVPFGTFSNTPWDLTAQTQPYFPSAENQNATGTAPLSILEIPNNGLDTFAHDASELIDRFNRNFPAGALTEPRAITYVSHPQWYEREFPRIDAVLEHFDEHLAAGDKGPVVYVNQDNLYNLWSE